MRKCNKICESPILDILIYNENEWKIYAKKYYLKARETVTETFDI
jgi:hypothetical protein